MQARVLPLIAVAWGVACSSSGGGPRSAEGPADGATTPLDGGVVDAAPTPDVTPTPDAAPTLDAPGGSFDSSTPDRTIPATMIGTWRSITPAQITDLATNPCTDLVFDPSNRSTLYAMYGGAGVWKSTDDGASWAAIGNLPMPTSLGRLLVDPADPEHLYATGSVTGSSLGFWVSHDGGSTWAIPPAFSAGVGTQWILDVYNMVVDPTDFDHVLLTFHQAWPNATTAGILETRDGGASYLLHPTPGTGMQYGQGVAFLYDPALGLGDKNTWLLGSGYASGIFRTADAGNTWTQVSTVEEDHGGFDAHYSAQGYLYIGASDGVHRSTDNGVTWDHPSTGMLANWTYSVISDGHFLYTSPGFVGQTYNQPFFVSPEGGGSEGETWTAFSAQILPEGPWRMRFDAANHILYNATWGGGAWAMSTQ